MLLKSKLAKILLLLAILIFYLVISISVLSDYGINWDEPFHFHRGQAYLHYFLTGERTFENLPPYPALVDKCVGPDKICKTGSPKGVDDVLSYYEGIKTYEEEIEAKMSEDPKLRRSYYQTEFYNFEYFVNSEDGHPPTSNILAAATNKVFFQNLGWVKDIESHHLYEVLVTFLLILGVAIFSYNTLGLFPAVVASLSIALYPLVFGESHFNIKDPPEMSLFGLSAMSFYWGVYKNKPSWVFVSSVFAGLALGTKFNALTLPLILGPWLAFFTLVNFRKIHKGFTKKTGIVWFFVLLLFPVIMFYVFYIFWPFLYSDPVNNFLKIFNYYKDIGTGTPPEISAFRFWKVNYFAIFWILVTTPIPILVLSAVGSIFSIYKLLKTRNPFYLFLLLWLIAPIARVSVPKTSIYGGIRQIMEFIPAMAILAGVGAQAILSFPKSQTKKNLLFLVVMCSFTFTAYELYKLHPNQNLYFNQLIGGLSGAKEREIPYWGSAYGNTYLQGINWINKNAEPNARLGLPISTMSNIPRHKLRADISFNNGHWSGPAKKGEFEIEMSHDFYPKIWYSYAYYDVYLNPAFEVNVDGVSVLKVWKNDLAHTRPGYEEEEIQEVKSITKEDNSLIIDLGQVVDLTRLTIEHSKVGCEKQKGGYIALSEDRDTWHRETESIDYPQVPPAAVGIDEDTFVYLFAAKKARFVEIVTGMENSCTLKNPSYLIHKLVGSSQ